MERAQQTATRLVVFDLGEVLATAPQLFSVLADRVGSSAAAVEVAYWAHRDDHDRGADATTFWSAVLDELGRPSTPRTIRELSDLDSVMWTTIRSDALDVLRDLSSGCHRVAILSNAPAELAVFARQAEWAPFISDWFFSGELLMTKPDPALYAHVTSSVGLAPEEIAFIDDRQVNVDAAQATGWNAHLWVSGADTRTFLTELGLLQPDGSETTGGRA